MAHLIGDRDNLISVRETPWHGLGIILPDYVSLNEAHVLAGLDWEVETRPVYVKHTELVGIETDDTERQLIPIYNESDIEVEGRKAVVRTDNGYPLGVVGDRYSVVQNDELKQLLASVLDDSDVKIETAGSLRNGRTVWYLARLGDDIIIGGDAHVPFLLITSTHDGTGAVQARVTPTRVVCDNTLQWSSRTAASSWSVRHTDYATAAINDVREGLKLSRAYYDEFAVEVEALQQQVVTDAKFKELTDNLFPLPVKVGDEDPGKRALDNAIARRAFVRRQWEQDPDGTIGDFAGTGWGALQSFSAWDLWERPVKGKGGRALAQANRFLTGQNGAFLDEVRKELAEIA